MEEETGQEEINDKTHAIESEEQTGDESFEADIKEHQKVPIVDDQQLDELPDEEENENILLTYRALKKAKPKMSSRSETKSTSVGLKLSQQI